MSVINDILGLKPLCNGERKSALWLWLAFAVWLPYVLTGVILAVSFAVILIFPDTRKAVMSQKRMFGLSCAIGGLSAISALTAGNYLGVLVALGIFVILICGCFLRATVERDIFNRACAILGLGSVAACISAVIQFEAIYNNPLYRPTAGAFNANYYGALTVFTVILAAIRFMEKDPEAGDALKWFHLPKWAWIAIGAVNIFAVLYCRSRSSLLALMACAFIYLVLSGRWLLALICAAGFGGVWVLGFLRPDIFNWENTLGFIFEQRVGIWKNAWDAYISSPRSILIGRGPMTYLFAKVSDANHAHNVLFDTLINVGVVGLGLYVALIVDILRDAWTNFKGHGREWLVSAVIVAEILVQGVFDVTIMWLQTGIMFMILAFPVGKGKSQNGK